MAGLWTLLSLLLFSSLATTSSSRKDDPPPGYITWPKQWHAEVMVADDGFWPFQDTISISGKGSFFYDSTKGAASYALTQSDTGRKVHEVITPSGAVYVVDGPTAACAVGSVSDAARYQLPSSFSPDFLSKRRFQFLGWEYYLRDGTYFETLHWQLPGDVLSSTIDYWHATATDTPFRIAWEQLSPVLLEFSGVVAGFDDVPNMDYFLTPPSSCKSATVSAPHSTARTQKHIPIPSTLTHKERGNAGTHPSRSSKLTGKAWPPQWHAISHYTGNDFGLQDISEGEPTTVAFSLTGHYYYDWVKQRECNVWVDVSTGARTNTLIVNGTFHIITLATNSCQLVPTYPVNGPLKPEWPTRLPYRDMQYSLTQSERHSYIKTNHYLYDAFGAGPKHSFNYWETEDTQSPVQFQGPVLEFWPYGQSMMRWESFVVGLNGLPLDTEIFYVPDDCSYIPAEEFLRGTNKISPAMRSLFRHNVALHAVIN